MKKRKIFILIERRADYSRYKPIMKLLKSDNFFELHLVVTGICLLDIHGNDINYIENDMYAEIFTNGLSNVKKEMIGELNQVIKKQTDVNNSSIKLFANNFLQNISNRECLELSNNEVNKQIEKKKTIDKQKNSICDINTIICDKVNLNELAKELLIKHYIDTDFYKKLILKEHEEEIKLKDKNNIGLYKKYSDIKKIREIKIKEVISLETNIEKLKNYYSELID